MQIRSIHAVPRLSAEARAFGHDIDRMADYLAVEMCKIVNRRHRLNAMDRAILARDDVRLMRRALRTEPLLFGEETDRLEAELAAAVIEFRTAIHQMMFVKRGRI